MYTAYNVAYGGLEPLRVWEGDINLSHVLSALGCTGEANSHPLGPGFVYRIQSILTKAGKSSLWKSKSIYQQNERSHPVSKPDTGFCDLEESGEWSSAEAHFLRARRRCLQPFVDRLREDLPDRIVVDLTDPVLRSLHLDTVLFSIFVDRLIQDQVNPVIGTHEIPLSLSHPLRCLKYAAMPTDTLPLRFRVHSATPSSRSCAAGS